MRIIEQKSQNFLKIIIDCFLYEITYDSIDKKENDWFLSFFYYWCLY